MTSSAIHPSPDVTVSQPDADLIEATEGKKQQTLCAPSLRMWTGQEAANDEGKEK